MPEKIYRLLLMLYPGQFRREYGDEALRLVRNRARDEKGFLSGLRLWLDLLMDLVISLPSEYSRTSVAAAEPVTGDPSFQLLAEPPLNSAVLLLAGLVSAVLLWACVTAVARSRTFPALFPDTHSLQALVQENLALARVRPEEEPGVCMTARQDIPSTSAQPLLTFIFAPPGASGDALIDGKIVTTFSNEQHLSIHAPLSSGEHHFALHLVRPVENTFTSSNEDLSFCRPK